MPNNPSRRAAVARHVRIILAALVAGLAGVALPASAQTWLPDPGYNNGLVSADAFAGSATRSYHGRKVAMHEGNTIVAGIVPALSGDLGALGLVHYNGSGTRLAWANPGTSGHYGNQYVVMPNGIFNRVTDVRDIVVFGSRIFVLVETERYVLGHPINNPGTHFHGYGVEVRVFGTDGSFKAATEVDFDNIDVANRTAWGSGIALYDNGSFPTVVTLMYAGRRKIGSVERPAIRRFTVEGSGSLTAAYNIQHPTFGLDCPADTHCSVFGIALGGRTTFTAPPRIYLVGSRFSNCQGICYHGWQTIVMRIDSNAQPVDSFSSNGLNFVQHGDGSRGRAIAVTGGLGVVGASDQIYVASEVDQTCAMGVQVAKFGQDGVDVAGFGDHFIGTLYGGSDIGSPQCALQHQLGTVRDSYPTGMALSGDVVAVSGYAVGGPGTFCQPGQTCAEDRVDGEAAVLATSDGALLSFQRYPFTATSGGARQRHSAYGDIAGVGEGEFMLAGEVRYVETESDAGNRSKSQFATLRIEPSQVVFSDGFE